MLLLITKDPSHPLAIFALRYAESYLNCGHNLEIFFYLDGAYTANCLRWQSADQINITDRWQKLAQDYKLDLTVCVSTALARGISDDENSKRHNLDTSNIAKSFRLVGLSDLILKMNDHKVIQF